MSTIQRKVVIAGREIKRIGNGGMGVQVSTSSLVNSVIKNEGFGTLASVGLGYNQENSQFDNKKQYTEASNEGLKSEINLVNNNRKDSGGLFLINIMHALTNFPELVETASSMKIDGIVSGAGLPLKLPELILNKIIALIPIISSPRVANIFIERWKKYNRLPDAFVIEGPLAGGHLGYKIGQFLKNILPKLEDILKDVVTYLYEKELEIPIIVAGGIWDPAYAAYLIKLGATAIQLGTPFILTPECSVHKNFKKAIIECKKVDIGIIKSPVGMPGRALLNFGIPKKLANNEKISFRCGYKCLETCDPKTAPYCIAEALFRATDGDLENGLFFCGANAWQLDKIVTVEELINDFLEKMYFEYKKL